MNKNFIKNLSQHFIFINKIWRLLKLYWPFFLIILFGGYFRLAGPIKEAIIVDSILISKTLHPCLPISKITNFDIRTHNSYLISMLQERYSSSIKLQSATDDSINQARTIYFGILVVILSLFFNAKEEAPMRFIVLKILLVLIFMIYSLEVHLKDKQDRQYSCIKLTGCVNEELVASEYINTKWYKFDLKERGIRWDNAKKPCNRYWRKFQKACYPELD